MKIEFLPMEKSQPVILLYDGTPTDVSGLQTALRDLSKNTNQEVKIHSLPGVEPVNGCQLFARLSQNDGGVRKLGIENSFEWLLTAPRWEDIADTIESFKQPWDGGHAFLEVKSKIALIISTGRGW